MARGAVVIAHSEHAVRQPLRDALERAGYETIGARDADEAIEAIRDRLSCLALLQGDLPGGGARRVHLWLEDGGRPNVPVAYLTTEDDDLHRTRLGLNPAFIAREPVDCDDLVRTVAEVIGTPAPRITGPDGGQLELLLIEENDERFDEIRDLLTWGGAVEFTILGAPTIHEARRILHAASVDCALVHVGQDRASASQVIGDLCHAAGERPVIAIIDAPDERIALSLMRQGCADVLDLDSTRRDRSLTFRVRKATQRSRRVRRAILSDAVQRSRRRTGAAPPVKDRPMRQRSDESREASPNERTMQRLHASPLAAGVAGALLCMAGFMGAKLTAPQLARGESAMPRPEWVRPVTPAPPEGARAHGQDLESVFTDEGEFREYCRHVALATLASQHVESDDNEIRFFKNTTESGSAIEQFADLFGRAIETRRNPSATTGGH